MIFRLILAEWATKEYPDRKRVLEGEFTDEEIQKFNNLGYNIYFLPNYPSVYTSGITVDGSHVDTFRFVFVDFDLKSGVYKDKNAFIDAIFDSGIEPTYMVDSGNGIHSYWQIDQLDAMTYLKLQRRLIRLFNTDEAVCKLYQLMRVPGTLNTKTKNELKECREIYNSHRVYTCEEIDESLPRITPEDEEFCRQHYDKTYNPNAKDIKIEDKLPLKFAHLIRDNNEVRAIWSGGTEDRSKSDFRLAHIMFANGFTKQEATSVLVNAAKALSRAPQHRISYATNIVDQIWTYEIEKDTSELKLSSSVGSLLAKASETKGSRLPCWRYLDDTNYGFRRGQVIGLVAGSGVGKTAIALNMFLGFVQNNPDLDHFFIPLEQPAIEIAERWKSMCAGKEHLYEKVQVLSNYEDNGQFRHLSFSEIRDYILKYQQVTGREVGCVVMDHIGALKKKGKDGENQDLMTICHEMKAFAIETNTLLVMQSQAPREKADIGDLELNKDAAYGTVYFESYCDYLITLWQPLKRCYYEGAPTVTAFKFCKIRHKKQHLDVIKEDVCYKLMFDPETERLRELSEIEEKSFEFFLAKATNKRKQDRKTDLVEYKSVKTEGDSNGATNHNQDTIRLREATGIH